MSLFWPKFAECSRLVLADVAVTTETKITYTWVFFANGATSGCSKAATEPDCWSEGRRAILDSIKYSQCFDLDDSHKDEQNPNGKKKPALRTKNPLIPGATGPLQLTVQETNLQYATLGGLYRTKESGNQHEKTNN